MTVTAASILDAGLELHPQVALRPEPFGALAYHYGNRRLVFLRHPDMVRVAEALAEHRSLAAALSACDVAPARYGSFARAFESLRASGIIRDRSEAGS